MRNSSNYILFFVGTLTAIVALVLSLMYTGLKEVHSLNESLFNKRAIISAISSYLDKPVSEMTDKEVQAVFEEKMEQTVVVPVEESHVGRVSPRSRTAQVASSSSGRERRRIWGRSLRRWCGRPQEVSVHWS